MIMSSFDVVKHIFDSNFGKEKQRLIYELSKVVDAKCDFMNSKLIELIKENASIKQRFTKSKRSILSKYGDAAITNPMQKAFVDCVDSVKGEIEKRRAL
jgi:hypothetical protein